MLGKLGAEIGALVTATAIGANTFVAITWQRRISLRQPAFGQAAYDATLRSKNLHPN